MISCCLNCPERNIYCHDRCERYQSEKRQHELELKRERLENEVFAYMRENHQKGDRLW